MRRLVGTLLQQTFRYFRSYPADPLYMKIWVLLVVILQLFSTTLIMHTSYYYLVTYYFNAAVFSKPDVWTSAFTPVSVSLGNLVAESFFARRVYMVGSRYRFVVVSAMAMILASCGFFIGKTAQVFAAATVLHRPSQWPSSAGSALLLAGDLQLTGVLVYVLHTGRSGFRRTDSMIDILIAYALTTGSLICVLNIVSLILTIVFPHNIIFTASTLVAQAVYANSFVVALNTRRVLRARGEINIHSADLIAQGIVLGHKRSSGAVHNEVPLRDLKMGFDIAQPAHTQDRVSGTSSGAAREGLETDERTSPGRWSDEGIGQDRMGVVDIGKRVALDIDSEATEV
ncbi:hypothetical protein PYCCODRAFT_1474773 [Trametes coccinea BRFM310]|uniref:DUF6534 domain-containing protein n=1 Tax=Trametes coccinea (strain BRFM310) TaxID=1353009 RepID=A0A1Y2IXG9_TRAC3|nr:hypothetical protein PYCCODRAFT_1474773 [Trametes coccinea BRFM310]